MSDEIERDAQNMEMPVSDDAVEATPDSLAAGHEESVEAIGELAGQVEQAEAAEGDAIPSQADADETAATGI